MINVGILGANGYTGAELMKILSKHKEADIKILSSRSEQGKKVTDVYPNLTQLKDKVFSEPDLEELSKMDVVFSCLPHAASSELCSKLYYKGVKIIDLSADFRYKSLDIYQNTYKVNHAAPELLNEAVYGLPEINREKIKKTSLVGNPGCYTTSSILPLYPVIKEDLVKSYEIIIDSKSGTSGAGKKADIDLNFTEVNESFKAYGVTTHRHTSEIEEVLSLNTQKDVKVCFTPHLLPINRGILSTIYAPLKKQVDESEVYNLYDKYYGNETFINITKDLPQIKWVTNTNNVFIGFRLDKKNNLLIIISVLDNLVKGASGQAVQNMNIMFGLDETTGII